MTELAPAVDDRRRVDGIHSAIDDALEAFPCEVADAARPLVRTVLAARAGSTATRGWGGSRLTGDGFPFELTFSSADRRLRFTAEPGGRDLPPPRRLAAALAVLQEAGLKVPAHFIETCQAIQRNAVLTYGAWVGCRVAGDGHALKLYVEVPEAQTATLPVSFFTLPDRIAVTRMIAYSPAGLESYVRVPSLEPRHLPAVLAPAGLEHRARDVVRIVTEAYGYRIRGRLPGASVGVSLAGTTDNPRVTVYLFARALWGSDARIRREVLRLAGTTGWDTSAYRRVTAPLASRDRWQTHHGLFGITLDQSATAFAIGVRPV